MRRVIEREVTFDAPLEQVGGTLERALDLSPRWALGGVRRESASLTATLRSGWLPWVDPAHFELRGAAPDSTLVHITLDLAVPWATRRTRVQHLDVLMAEVRALLLETVG